MNSRCYKIRIRTNNPHWTHASFPKERRTWAKSHRRGKAGSDTEIPFLNTMSLFPQECLPCFLSSATTQCISFYHSSCPLPWDWHGWQAQAHILAQNIQVDKIGTSLGSQLLLLLKCINYWVEASRMPRLSPKLTHIFQKVISIMALTTLLMDIKLRLTTDP